MKNKNLFVCVAVILSFGLLGLMSGSIFAEDFELEITATGEDGSQKEAVVSGSIDGDHAAAAEEPEEEPAAEEAEPLSKADILKIREQLASTEAEKRRQSEAVRMAAQEGDVIIPEFISILPVTGSIETAFIILVSFGLGLVLPRVVVCVRSRIRKQD